MSIQSQINQTFAMTAGAVVLAHKTKVKEALAAQKELEKEKKLQMRQSEAAQKLAAARQKEQDRLKNEQRTDLTKRIQKYFAAKVDTKPRRKGTIGELYSEVGQSGKEAIVKAFLEANKTTAGEVLATLGGNKNGKE